MLWRAVSCLGYHITDKPNRIPLFGFHLLECHKRDLEGATLVHGPLFYFLVTLE